MYSHNSIRKAHKLNINNVLTGLSQVIMPNILKLGGPISFWSTSLSHGSHANYSRDETVLQAGPEIWAV